MTPPAEPHIKTTYRPDGSVVVEPVGFGGTLCHKATAPYIAALGGEHTETLTAEAGQEPCLVKETKQKVRE